MSKHSVLIRLLKKFEGDLSARVSRTLKILLCRRALPIQAPRIRELSGHNLQVPRSLPLLPFLQPPPPPELSASGSNRSEPLPDIDTRKKRRQKSHKTRRNRRPASRIQPRKPIEAASSVEETRSSGSVPDHRHHLRLGPAGERESESGLVACRQLLGVARGRGRKEGDYTNTHTHISNVASADSSIWCLYTVFGAYKLIHLYTSEGEMYV